MINSNGRVKSFNFFFIFFLFNHNWKDKREKNQKKMSYFVTVGEEKEIGYDPKAIKLGFDTRYEKLGVKIPSLIASGS